MSKLLLVEDNLGIRDMLRRRLEKRKFEVVLAGDGLEACAKAVSERPHLILLDMNLPLLDGFMADLEQIKASANRLQMLLLELLDVNKMEVEETEFCRRVRHDLRTPLTHIMGLCELWIEDAQEQMLAVFVADLKKVHDLS